jgi:hypothetical protein
MSFWSDTAALLLRDRPVIPGLVDLLVCDEELLADLFIGYLEKEGSADLNTLVS